MLTISVRPGNSTQQNFPSSYSRLQIEIFVKMTGGEHFVGKYQMISQDNLDDYLKAIGKFLFYFDCWEYTK